MRFYRQESNKSSTQPCPYLRYKKCSVDQPSLVSNIAKWFQTSEKYSVEPSVPNAQLARSAVVQTRRHDRQIVAKWRLSAPPNLMSDLSLEAAIRCTALFEFVHLRSRHGGPWRRQPQTEKRNGLNETPNNHVKKKARETPRAF